MADIGGSSRVNTSKVDEEIVVGFDNEIMMIKEQLTGGKKQREVISIIGMAGLGKTTLARKVYDDPLIVYHFYIRAWAYVSQVYRKRDLLLGILSYVIELTDEMHEMSDEELSLKLKKGLMGRRYLIVMDDIWSVDAWDCLKRSFPDDNNGSRIMFTSRLKDVALHAQPDSHPHCLRFLTEDESWYLFQQKVFGKETCPQVLMGIGKQITKKCLGLPLAIVVTAGLLAKVDRRQASWEQVAKNVSSHILDTLALSYNHLPSHLKTCFLYLGSFGKGREISVRNLIWAWVSGGFIKRIGEKCLEDVAEDYLMDLISRSLVIVAKKRFDREIITCRIHDLLLDLYLIKAKEENFMQQFYSYPNPYPISLPSSHIHVHSFRCFVLECHRRPGNINFRICPTLRLVRMLDLSSIHVDLFPSKILQLVHLSYLAFRAHDGSLPASISNLRNLQTFILSSRRNITIPQNFWKIVTLRHLYIKSGINVIEYPCFGDPAIGDDSPSLMADLQTISRVCPSRSCRDVLTKAPNLRELGFCGPLISKSGDLIFPDLSNKNHLETLKLLNTRSVVDGTTSTLCDPMNFPEKLKRLTLSGTNLKWREMWILGILPNLEALKLKFHACVGPCWETCDGGFLRLKFLKFEGLDIVQWNASDSHFPSLERLVLHSCQKLVGIPSDLADISTLELIELNWCSHSSTKSALQIQKQQESKGNDLLKVHIKPLEQEKQESKSQHQEPFLKDYLPFGTEGSTLAEDELIIAEQKLCGFHNPFFAGTRFERTSDSWIIVSPTVEDEYAWRKYGQKDILNAKFPRCYYGCAHRNDRGCGAVKQVQRMKEDPNMYQTTYFGRHTCREILAGPQMIISDSD